MKNILILLENNIRLSILKKPFGFLLYTLMPVMIIMLTSEIITFTQGYIGLVIIDKDNSKTSQMIVEEIKNTEGIKVVDVNENNIEEKFAQKDIDLSVEIPKNFEAQIINNKDVNINLKTPENSNLYEGLYANLQIQVQNLKDIGKISEGNIKSYYKFLEDYNNGGVKINKKSLNDLSNDYEQYMIFLGFLILTMFFKAASGAYNINLDKSNNIYTKIFVAPVRTYEYYIANLFSSVIYLLAQIIISIFGLKYILKLEIGMEYSHLFIILLVVAIVAVALGNLCIAITKTSSEASMISNAIIMLFAMLGGCFVPMEMLPDFVNKIAYFTPVKWAMMSITDLQQGISFEYIIKNLGIMLLFALTFLTITAYSTSRKEKEFNLYG